MWLAGSWAIPLSVIYCNHFIFSNFYKLVSRWREEVCSNSGYICPNTLLCNQLSEWQQDVVHVISWNMFC